MLNKLRLNCFCCLACAVFIIVQNNGAVAQDEPSILIPQFSGYVKYMEIIPYTRNIDENPLTGLLHNRLNFKWYFSDNITSAIEVRNQFYFGKGIKAQQPAFGNALENDEGWVDLSFVPINEKSAVFHSMIDRAWVEYVKRDWNIKVGRQRINWGINLAWNPNDIFNSYNFLDFDYEERPGSDAVKITNYISSLSFVEVAVKLDNNIEDMVIAGRYQINKKGYDVQFLGGKFMEDIVIGTGWAGNIKDAGFKGELSYFHPYEDIYGSKGIYSISTSLDYSFEKGWYINGAYLFNSNANDYFFFLIATGLLELSAKNLYPATHTISASVSKQFSPLVTGSFNTVYSPRSKALILLPTFNLSVSENMDLDVIAQLFYGESPKKFKNITNGFYIRGKYSF